MLPQVDIQEFPVDHLTLSVAQRYSVLVTARNDTSENFYMHANFDSMMFDTVPDDLQLSKSPLVPVKHGKERCGFNTSSPTAL